MSNQMNLITEFGNITRKGFNLYYFNNKKINYKCNVCTAHNVYVSYYYEGDEIVIFSVVYKKD